MENYIFSKPLEFEGKTYTEINMDLDGLSVDDLERCERQARSMLRRKENMSVPETNKKYQACVAAKASGMPIEAIRALSGKDYTQVCLLVMNFLLDGDSEEDDEEEKENTVGPQPEAGGTPISKTTLRSPDIQQETEGHQGSWKNLG